MNNELNLMIPEIHTLADAIQNVSFGVPEIMLIVCVGIGVVCSFIPAIPGTLFIVFSTCLYGFYDNFTMFTIPWLVSFFLISFVGGFGQYAVTGWCSHKFGASRAGVVGAMVLMPFGFLLPIPGGLIAGAAVGAFVGEYYFSKNDDVDVEKSMRAAAGAALGTVLSILFEVVFAIILAITIFGRVLALAIPI